MPNSRCKHLQGRNAATPTTPVDGCGYFLPKVRPAATDPLTPAERAELDAFNRRHPMALLDPAQMARWQELARRAQG